MEKENVMKKTSRKQKRNNKAKLGKVVLLVLVIAISILLGWLVANMSDTTYSVAFDVGNGTNNTVVKVEGKNNILKPADPTKEGYIFEGWYVGNEKFDFNTEITEDITLTAKWTKEPEKYTVIFNTDGGSEVAEVIVEENKTVAKPADPTRSGYTFAGWYLNDTEYDFTKVITGDVTLTAKWNKVEQTSSNNSNKNNTTTTTKKDTITWKRVDVSGALFPQERIYIVKNGKYVAGTADFVDTTGAVVTKSVPASGKIEPKGSVKTLKNIKVN